MLLRRNKTLPAFVAFVFAMLLSVPSLLAQTFRGGITGTVVDPQGASIANASVKLTNPATGSVVDGKSNGAGEFNFPELTPGLYKVTVAVPGFQTAQIDNINVEVTKIVPVKAVLAIGSENTVVDVQANAIQTDTTSSALVAVIDSKSVRRDADERPQLHPDDPLRAGCSALDQLRERLAYGQHQLPARWRR